MSINPEDLVNSLNINPRLSSDYLEKLLLYPNNNDYIINPIPNNLFLDEYYPTNQYQEYYFESLPECTGKLCESVDNQWVCGS